ncbi:MAG: Fpg/Nei family DNA glycosylase [Hamadaea sp.]|uniref:Fpg/Nei family DNA glycosylase n=1 Tax=Hamadaea sp. TaxID=2024425 RepID=UPI00182E29A2|nr:DNA-formamidopyrimidine glycosylase family protein [Hamadaea sp.]NUT22458.1 Fpg/Nei family DNA glycosylase [Hamadaea sp.]
MPEGHTIHRLAARHAELFGGRPVRVSSPQGRFAAGAELISGGVLRRTEAYGKHLLHHYDDQGDDDRGVGHTLHVHLGLYGVFTDGSGTAPEPVGQVRLRLESAEHWLDLRGPAACELLDPPEVEALKKRLGADPLRDDADPEAAYARIRRSSTAIAALLMDQKTVAGCGLVYACEVLFRAGIEPTRPGTQITPHEWAGLWKDLQELMREGVRRGRIDTVHATHLPEAMGRAPRVDRHGGEVYVYRRAGQPCLLCGTEVRRGTLAARNSYWCPRCQVGTAAGS